MAAMFKLTLLMILAAVCFLPQDGVDAVLCHCDTNSCLTASGGNRTFECTPPAFLPVCIILAVPGTKVVERGCLSINATEYKDETTGCKDVTGNNNNRARACFCTTRLCNSEISASDCLHGWTSSVLNGISVLILVIPIPFLRRQ